MQINLLASPIKNYASPLAGASMHHRNLDLRRLSEVSSQNEPLDFTLKQSISAQNSIPPTPKKPSICTPPVEVSKPAVPPQPAQIPQNHPDFLELQKKLAALTEQIHASAAEKILKEKQEKKEKEEAIKAAVEAAQKQFLLQQQQQPPVPQPIVKLKLKLGNDVVGSTQATSISPNVPQKGPQQATTNKTEPDNDLELAKQLLEEPPSPMDEKSENLLDGLGLISKSERRKLKKKRKELEKKLKVQKMHISSDCGTDLSNNATENEAGEVAKTVVNADANAAPVVESNRNPMIDPDIKNRKNYDINFTLPPVLEPIPKLNPLFQDCDPISQKILNDDLITEDLEEFMHWPKPVNDYKPPKVSPNLGLDISNWPTYPCIDCNDTFLIESSLTYHYNRKSVLIDMFCVACDKKLKFFNRCELLKHARMHKDLGQEMKFKNASVRVLPLEYLTAKKPDFSKDERYKQLFGKISCTECPMKFSTDTALKVHFQRIEFDEENDSKSSSNDDMNDSGHENPNVQNNHAKALKKLQCPTCQLQLTNKCSYKAHIRYHNFKKPYTCPDTGKTFNETSPELTKFLTSSVFEGKRLSKSQIKKQTLDSFIDYLEVVSCHKWKTNLYRLPKEADEEGAGDGDKMFFESFEKSVEYQMSRIRCYFQCTKCTLAFKSKKDLRRHSQTEHNIQKLKDYNKHIFRCPYSENLNSNKQVIQDSIQKNYQPIMFSGYTFNEHMYECLEDLKLHMAEFGESDPDELVGMNSNGHRGGRFKMFKCPLCSFDRAYNKIQKKREKSGSKSDGEESICSSGSESDEESNDNCKPLQTFQYEQDFIDHLIEVHGGKEDLIKFTNAAAKTADMVLPKELSSQFYEKELKALEIKSEKERKNRKEKLENLRKEKLKIEKMKLAKIEKTAAKNVKAAVVAAENVAESPKTCSAASDVFPCGKCPTILLSEQSRVAHMSEAHKEENVNEASVISLRPPKRKTICE